MADSYVAAQHTIFRDSTLYSGLHVGKLLLNFTTMQLSLAAASLPDHFSAVIISVFRIFFFFVAPYFEWKSTGFYLFWRQVQDLRNSTILPARAKIKSYNEPWQLLNGNSVWANLQEERSHNALISDNNLHCSSSCAFSQIARKQQIPVSSPFSPPHDTSGLFSPTFH